MWRAFFFERLGQRARGGRFFLSGSVSVRVAGVFF